MQERKSYGPCVSKERCMEILTEEVQDHLPEGKWEDYERSVNRVLYEFDKLDGKKPKLNKGRHIADWYTCGNCGCKINLGNNFCQNCGYKVIWDEIRCMTDRKGLNRP